jgi:hypothetical protein
MTAWWTAFLTTKAGRCLAAIGGFLLALAVFAFYVWRKATQHQADKDEAKDAAVNAQQAKEAAEAVQRSADAVKETNDEIAKMPDAGTQRVADAAPDSAAGWLHDHANRDQANP